jgi:hypothetical protein
MSLPARFNVVSRVVGPIGSSLVGVSALETR